MLIQLKPLSHSSLAPWNTFNIKANAKSIFMVENIEQLRLLYREPCYQDTPKLILGEGSNVIFTSDFDGIIILNRIKGLQVREDQDYFYIDVASGEHWHDLVEWSLTQGYYGLENLALIPGFSGSAPIQNIGAYGVEFKDVCDYVRVINIKTGMVELLTNEACQFNYRDSIFKQLTKSSTGSIYAIIAIGLKLSKQWKPKLSYNGLTELPSNVTAQEIFNQVCELRRHKLPDPKEQGNAGSFFKNPVVTLAQLERLKQKFPSIPTYPVNYSDQHLKLAAGWLIDQCGLKGFQIGGAKVHPQQALVLVNFNHATAQDLILLAQHVINQVELKFNVTLETEVRLMGAHGEVELADLLLS